MFMCFTKCFSEVNLDLFWKQVFSYKVRLRFVVDDLVQTPETIFKVLYSLCSLGARTLNITTFSIMTLSINYTQHERQSA